MAIKAYFDRFVPAVIAVIKSEVGKGYSKHTADKVKKVWQKDSEEIVQFVKASPDIAGAVFDLVRPKQDTRPIHQGPIQEHEVIEKTTFKQWVYFILGASSIGGTAYVVDKVRKGEITTEQVIDMGKKHIEQMKKALETIAQAKKGDVEEPVFNFEPEGKGEKKIDSAGQGPKKLDKTDFVLIGIFLAALHLGIEAYRS